MKIDDFSSFVENRFMKQREWYSQKADYNKKMYQRLQLIMIVLSSVLPIFSFNEWVYSKYISTVLAITVTISASIITTYKYHEHWLNYRTTSELLKKEKIFFDMKTSHYRDIDDPELLFVERVESLVSVENRQWKTTEDSRN